MSQQPLPVMLPCPRDQLPQVRLSSTSPLVLIWPVVFIYPFYGLTDLITDFADTDTFLVHLNRVLSPTPRWDTYQKFRDREAVKLYYRNSKAKLVPVSPLDSLGSVMRSGDFLVMDSLPAFYLVRLISEIPK